MPDVHEQLSHVLAGRTADGHPGRGQVIVLGDARQQALTGLLLLSLFRDLESLLPELMKQDRMRTAVILVFVRWLRAANIGSRETLRLLYAVGPPGFPLH